MKNTVVLLAGAFATCAALAQTPEVTLTRLDCGNGNNDPRRFTDSFAYKDNDHVLRNVSFEVRPGERVGIVGATGAGKSTLISLLLRFYDVTSGHIAIDGVDIREMDLGALRNMFGLVLQDVHLFSGTIAGNIRLGDASIDDARVHVAARAVHAHRFIESLPGGVVPGSR